jgi:hypothetical protein
MLMKVKMGLHNMDESRGRILLIGKSEFAFLIRRDFERLKALSARPVMGQILTESAAPPKNTSYITSFSV